MEITEVRVKLVDGKQDKLKAFCSITIDDAFVVRDLKIIEGSKGLFVAMPSRKLTARCPKCGAKNQIRSNFCCECGYDLPAADGRDRRGGGRGSRDGRQKMHADIAHPINSDCRDAIQSRVLETYQDEIEASQEPGYTPKSLDDLDPLEDEFDDFDPATPVSQAPSQAPSPPPPRGPERRGSTEPPPRSRSGRGGIRPNRKKSVEADDPPPDDNFGVGIF